MRNVIIAAMGLVFAAAPFDTTAQPVDCRITNTCPKTTPKPTPAPTSKPQRPQPKPPAGASRAPGHLASVWLRGGLYGSDNAVAALMNVSIQPLMSTFVTPAGAKYKVTIKNQFNMTCDLFANTAGDPGRLENCEAPTDPQGGVFKAASTDVIYLKCHRYRKEVVCSGVYNLELVFVNRITKEKYGGIERDEIKIARRL